MAEAIGAASGVAGLLSLAIQLAEGAVKLKRFYDRVKHIQASLASVVHSVETLSLALRDLEGHRQSCPLDDVVLARSIDACMQKAHQIVGLVRDLEHSISKNGVIGRAHAGMRKTDLLPLMTELEYTKSSIHITLQMYHFSIQAYWQAKNFAMHNTLLDQIDELRRAQTWPQMRSCIEVEEVEEFEDVEPRSSTVHGSPKPELTRCGHYHMPQYDQDTYVVVRSRRPSREFRTRHWSLRISSLSWLTGCIWEFAMTGSSGDWKHRFVTWHVTSAESAIFEYCDNGDVDAVRQLFLKGRASARDVDSNGNNLLYGRGPLELCRFLLNESEFPKISDVILLALYRYSMSAKRHSAGADTSEAEEMYRLCLERREVDIDLYDDLPHPALRTCNNERCLSIILRNQPLSDMPSGLAQRFEQFVHNASRTSFLSSPKVIMRWLGESNVTPQLASLTGRNGYTILHSVAQAIFSKIEEHHDTRRRITYNGPHNSLADWTEFGRQLLVNKANCCALWRRQSWDPVSPFLGALSASLVRNDYMLNEPDFPLFLDFVQYWSMVLEDADIDLAQYWITEGHIWQSKALKAGGVRPEFSGLDQHPRYLLTGPICRGKDAGQATSWSFQAVEVNEVPVFQLQLTPGGWTQRDDSVTTVTWLPNEVEALEGRWKPVKCMSLVSNPFDIQDGAVDRQSEHFIELLSRCQDDTGPIALRLSSRRLQCHIRQRSASQPPPLRRRLRAYCEDIGYDRRPWLFCHLCPVDNRWRMTCLDKTWGFPDALPLRHCMRADPPGVDYQEDANRWGMWSFLSEKNRRLARGY